MSLSSLGYAGQNATFAQIETFVCVEYIIHFGPIATLKFFDCLVQIF